MLSSNYRAEQLILIQSASRQVYIYAEAFDDISRFKVDAYEPFEDDPNYCFHSDTFDTLDEAKADAWRVFNEA